MTTRLFAVLAVLIGAANTSHAQSAADSSAVRAAVSDYIEGLYAGDTNRFNRSIRRDVHKYGFSRTAATGRVTGHLMNWNYFLESAAEVRSGTDKAPPNALRKIELLDVMENIAVAKLTALWGVDYLTLGKYDGKWMIQQVMGGPFDRARQ